MVGCVQRTLTVTSDPPGALVYANGNEIGRTPITRDFIWYGTYDVQLRADGYQTLDAHTPVIAPIWQWPPFDFFAEFWPGRLKDIRTISYKLEPASTQPVDATLMIARAAELHAKMEYSPYTKEPTTRSATQASTKPTTKPS
jgi:hypothetical protein